MIIKNKRIATNLKVIAGTFTAIFTLFTAFTSTFAWFASKTSVEATGAMITVKTGDGINYELYYLDHFVVNESNKDGNFNSVAQIHSGYEVSASNPVFNKINFDSNGHVIDDEENIVSDELNPTNISHLWPAHKLTYAIVLTQGEFNKFCLESWSEQTSADSITKDDQDNDVRISLSWAINIYGAAYNVTKTNDIVSDIANGFTTNYRGATLSDAFNYSQASPAPSPKPTIDVTDTISGEASDQTRQILYFSIEFDDSNSTYYKLDESHDYYTKDTSGNSNCYENLSLTDLVFKIV